MANSIDSKISGAGVGSAGLIKDARSSINKDKNGGLNFEDTLMEQVNKTESAEKPDSLLVQQTDKIANSLESNAVKAKDKPILKFSNHAVERMNSRGIHFTPEQITKIEQGMQKANEKGAKEALVLADDSALIVSLKNNTVVTVMDKNMMRENVFTNIDSTVFV